MSEIIKNAGKTIDEMKNKLLMIIQMSGSSPQDLISKN